MTRFGRFVVSSLLTLLILMAVVLPNLLNKQNIQPSLDKARAVVKQSQDRAKELAALEANAAGNEEPSSSSEAVENTEALPEGLELQRAAQDAVASGGRDIDKLNAVRDKAAKYNEARLKLAD